MCNADLDVVPQPVSLPYLLELSVVHSCQFSHAAFETDSYRHRKAHLIRIRRHRLLNLYCWAGRLSTYDNTERSLFFTMDLRVVRKEKRIYKAVSGLSTVRDAMT